MTKPAQGPPTPVRRELAETAWAAFRALAKGFRRDEVTTGAEISGPRETPRVGTCQILRRLIGNGFSQTILPGFGKEATRPRRTEK